MASPPELAGMALKTISDKLTEDRKRREANNYIFIVQISCTFPLWYYHSSPGSMITIPNHTLRGSYSFTSKIPKEEIKEEIWKVEETLIKAYEEAIMRRYGIKYDRSFERIMEYELEVNIE